MWTGIPALTLQEIIILRKGDIVMAKDKKLVEAITSMDVDLHSGTQM